MQHVRAVDMRLDKMSFGKRQVNACNSAHGMAGLRTSAAWAPKDV